MVQSWLQFFRDAGIPSPYDTKYSVIFDENRIKMDMLLDLSKDYLREMKITIMGDMISILKHAEKVAAELKLEEDLMRYEPDNVKTAAAAAFPPEINGIAETSYRDYGPRSSDPVVEETGTKAKTTTTPLVLSSVIKIPNTNSNNNHNSNSNSIKKRLSTTNGDSTSTTVVPKQVEIHEQETEKVVKLNKDLDLKNQSDEPKPSTSKAMTAQTSNRAQIVWNEPTRSGKSPENDPKAKPAVAAASGKALSSNGNTTASVSPPPIVQTCTFIASPELSPERKPVAVTVLPPASAHHRDKVHDKTTSDKNKEATTARRRSSSASSYEHYECKSIVRKVENKPKNYLGKESVEHERQHGGHKSYFESPRHNHNYHKFSPNVEKQSSEERKRGERRLERRDRVSPRPSTSKQSALCYQSNRKSSSEDHVNSKRVRKSNSNYNEHDDRSRSPAHEEREHREEFRSHKRPSSRERLDSFEPPRPRSRERPKSRERLDLRDRLGSRHLPRSRERPGSYERHLDRSRERSRSREERRTRSPPGRRPRSREWLRSREEARPRERPNLLGTPPPGGVVKPNIIYEDHGSRYECKSLKISRNYNGPKKLTSSFFV